jgi:hypothetical protein
VTVLTLKLIGFPFQVVPQATSMKLPDMGHNSFPDKQKVQPNGSKAIPVFQDRDTQTFAPPIPDSDTGEAAAWLY